jgi:dTDP-4-amino-4,6-dideoxygalactose transaminase
MYSEDEIDAVARVLRSGRVNYWTGQEGREFEREYADHLGVDHAIAVANGSVALELPLKAWGIAKDDEVIVTPRSFIASASCVVLQGARPVFADVDFDSGNISAETIAPLITSRTKAIVLVHLAGWPCEMDEILDLAGSHGLKVLEDCSQAHGAIYKERKVGSIGDVGTFSFCQDKIISTGGEGGLVSTNDSACWEFMWSFKDHGKSWKSVYEESHPIGFRWLHDRIGTNFRMTESQSTIGRLQLRKLDDWLAARRRNAKIFRDRFSGVSALRVPVPPEYSEHSYYRLYVYLQPEALKTAWSRDRILQTLCDRGFPVLAGGCSEIYLEKSFKKSPFQPPQRLLNARLLGDTSLMLPVHPTLDEESVGCFADAVSEVMQIASR